MNELYRQGFMNKCAELGVDPARLVKVARGEQIVKLLNRIRAKIPAGADMSNIPGADDFHSLTSMQNAEGAKLVSQLLPRGGHAQHMAARLVRDADRLEKSFTIDQIKSMVAAKDPRIMALLDV